MASRSYSTCTLAASGSDDGLAACPATPTSELATTDHRTTRPMLVRMMLALLISLNGPRRRDCTTDQARWYPLPGVQSASVSAGRTESI